MLFAVTVACDESPAADLAITSECHPRMDIPATAVTNAQAIDNFGQPAVHLRLNPAYTRRLADLSADCVGAPVCVVRAGAELMCPIIREPLIGGAMIVITPDMATAESIVDWAR